MGFVGLETQNNKLYTFHNTQFECFENGSMIIYLMLFNSSLLENVTYEIQSTIKPR